MFWIHTTGMSSSTHNHVISGDTDHVTSVLTTPSAGSDRPSMHIKGRIYEHRGAYLSDMPRANEKSFQGKGRGILYKTAQLAWLHRHAVNGVIGTRWMEGVVLGRGEHVRLPCSGRHQP